MIKRRILLNAFGASLIFKSLPVRGQASNSYFDVIIVGAGGSGLAAAIEAKSNGATVLLIEKQSFVGGDTLISGGYYNSPDGEIQNQQGIFDSEELYLKQIRESANGLGNPKVQETLVKNAFPTLQWLKEHGVVFEGQVFQIYGSRFPRSHRPILSQGSSYVHALSQSCLKLGVKVLTSTRFESFSRKGAEFLVQAKQGEKSVSFSCGALVLCAGGFARSPELLGRYVPNVHFIYSDSKGTGEVLQEAYRNGVALENMSSVECVPEGSHSQKYSARIYVLLEGMAFVNEDGERFIDESAPRNKLSEALISQGGKPCYTIVDSTNLKRLDKISQKNLYRAYFAGQVWKNDTLKGLCEDLDIPYEPLISSFAQISPQTRPQNPPFWAVRMYPWVHYTLGGLKIDDRSRCLSTDSEVIPGLFAAGQITGSLHGENRLGGNGLTDAFVFGRIAGKEASQYALSIKK